MRSLFKVFTLASSLVYACGGDGSQTTEVQDSNIYAASGTIWKPSVIPVCWQNGTAANATERQWVRSAVEGSWEAQAAVHFIGWDVCNASSPGVRIRIEDSGPHVKALGNDLNGMANGMVLNFTFQNWSPSCQNSREYCIRTIAVHEFGHALGFAHEQNRSDTPSWCDDEQGPDGDVTVGAWDLHSVMNYCNPAWSGHGNLSEIDIQGVRTFYGVRNPEQRVFYGLPLSLYQATFNDFVAEGYYPVAVDFSTVAGGQVMVTGIFERGQINFRARHGLTGSQYQSEFDLRTSQGYRLAHLDTYTVGSDIRYAAIFILNRGVNFVAYHGLTAAQHQQRFNTLTAQGYRPKVISPVSVNGTTYFAALYEVANVGSFFTLSGLTATQYQTQFTANAAAGRSLKYVTVYLDGATPRFSAIWDARPLNGFFARHGTTLSQTHQHHLDATEGGMQLQTISAYQDGSRVRFAAQWID